MIIKKIYSISLIFSSILFGGCASTEYLVQLEASQGAAAPGNTQPANFLAVVTEAYTGAPIAGLDQSNFTIINHMSNPGQKCGFSNNITSFNDVGTGAYHIQVGLKTDIPGCVWVNGKYLTQLMVVSGSKKGQGTTTLSILPQPNIGSVLSEEERKQTKTQAMSVIDEAIKKHRWTEEDNINFRKYSDKLDHSDYIELLKKYGTAVNKGKFKVESPL